MPHRHNKKSKQTGLITFPSALHLVPRDHTPLSYHTSVWASTTARFFLGLRSLSLCSLGHKNLLCAFSCGFCYKGLNHELCEEWRHNISPFLSSFWRVFPANLPHINLLSFQWIWHMTINHESSHLHARYKPSLLWTGALRIKFCDSFASLSSLSKDL